VRRAVAAWAARSRQRRLLKPLLVGAVAVLLTLAFAELAGQVLAGETHAVDHWVLGRAALWRAEHPWLTDVMRDLSGIGSTVTLTLATLITTGYLWLVASASVALLVAASVGSGAALMALLKLAFGRLRPDIAQAAMVVPGLSFPSGHTTMAAIVFMTLGTLIASTRTRARERGYILGAAAVLTLLVGISRVVLGVHWATDVLGGWVFGAGWAMAWLLIVGAAMRAGRHAT
jgi:undecaprenyl-diphosphatase